VRKSISIICTISAFVALADGDAREIWDNNFRDKRPGPAPASPGKTTQYRLPARTPTSALKASGAAPAVGITMWRLRRPTARDEQVPRLLVPEAPSSAPTEYVPERISLDESLRVGDRIRLAIESPREGYLYVIDRERYRDAIRGRSYLLFPLTTINHGENRVSAGRLIEIPGQHDPTPAIRVERRDPRHIGEELTLIVSPQPLAGVQVGAAAQVVPEELVSRWEREFTDAPVRLDLVMNREASWTEVEKSAGDGQRQLTPEDPMPQSIFVTNGDHSRGLIVHIPLEVHQ
jgi:hypothetical protein